MFKSERPTYESTSWSSLIYFASRLVGDRVFHPDTKCSFLPKVLACLTTPPKTALAKAAVADWAACIQKPLVVMMLAVLCVSGVVAYPARARGLAEEPEIWVNDAFGTETDDPFFPIEVEATLTSSSTQEITVDYNTEDGSAKAGVNYTSTSGTLTFAPGSFFGHVKIPNNARSRLYRQPYLLSSVFQSCERNNGPFRQQSNMHHRKHRSAAAETAHAFGFSNREWHRG
jgi:hypothetical protein